MSSNLSRGNYSDRSLNTSNPMLTQVIESTSRPPFQSAASAVTSMDSNQLESVINNYNRIYCQSQQNFNTNWLNSFFDLMKSEWTRLRSFHGRQNIKWTVESVAPEELARAGLFFLFGDRVQCAFCRGVISNWEPGMSLKVVFHFRTNVIPHSRR